MHTKKYIFSIILFQLFLFVGCAQNTKKNKDNTMNSVPVSKHQNRLAKAKSPYLQQHADNPVDWFEWGEEALNKAKKENKPIIISIGYAACHWCHVMEHESFMDAQVAKLMNENFVSIKIDREERPDIDQIYMDAVQLITGSGGWPLNAFAMPDGKPFYAGTYYPKEQWIQVLTQLSEVYKKEPEKVKNQAEQLTLGIKDQEMLSDVKNTSTEFSEKTYENVFKSWKSMIDFNKGGYQRAPKFPLPVGWEFLLQYHYLTGNKEALKAVTTTLDEMAKGGIYDQIGGGFARYSTDANWFAPHFEKMLYDNAQLVSLYSHAYQLTKNETYAEVIRETLAFIKREMTHSQGGFYASLNADSEGEEGKFYVWTQQEITKALDPKDANLIAKYYQLKANGNWEKNNNILFRKTSKKEFANQNNLSEKEWDVLLTKAKKTLLDERAKRTRPSTDDKVLTSWNALMLQGYIAAYLALGEKEYLEIALKNAHFLEKEMIKKQGGLWRNYKDGSAGIDAFLDDYAFLAKAFIQLYQATFDIHWLNQAKSLTDYAITHFQDKKTGMFFYTSNQSESLIARKTEISDNVIPASNSEMAKVLYQLGEYFDEPSYIEQSKKMVGFTIPKISTQGPYYANWGMLLGLMTYKPFEIAIMGSDAQQKNEAMQKEYLPTAFFMGGQKENLPLLAYKNTQGNTLIYVCKNKTCKYPVEKVADALQQIQPKP